MKMNEMSEKYDYSTLGFNDDAKFIYFRKDEAIIALKSSLKKEDLIAYLEIHPDFVKKAKKEIMEQAYLQGRNNWVYYIDGYGWQKGRTGGQNRFTSACKTKLVGLEEYKDFPLYAEKQLSKVVEMA